MLYVFEEGKSASGEGVMLMRKFRRWVTVESALYVWGEWGWGWNTYSNQSYNSNKLGVSGVVGEAWLQVISSGFGLVDRRWC